jgi:hypothetical protein
MVHGPVRDDASGTLIRWLMPPDPAGDRLPIGVADLAARESAYWDGNRFGQYFCVLDGEIMDGDRVGPAVGVHVDAPHALPMAAGGRRGTGNPHASRSRPGSFSGTPVSSKARRRCRTLSPAAGWEAPPSVREIFLIVPNGRWRLSSGAR